MATRSAAVVALALAGLLLTGCQDDAARDPDATGTTATGDGTPSTPAPSTPTASEPSPTGSGEPDAGRLDWKPVPGPTSTTVTVSGPWTLRVPQSGGEAVLDGPDPRTVTAPARHRVTDALIDGEYAVVVTEDERAQQPNTATVVDLATGRTFTLDGDADVPTTTGGSWALGEGRLLHATSRGGAYCLASVDLATRDGEVAWCAPPRSGFNGVRVTDAGTALLSFDSARPSCRTVGEISDGELVPVDDAPACTGWDALLLGDATLWSVAAKQSRIEEAALYVRDAGQTEGLGAGTSGSLVACGGSAYFVRDPQRGGDPARLMRWTPGEGLSVAYETRAVGGAFLSEPRCGGDAITLTALTEDGDEQVTATVD